MYIKYLKGLLPLLFVVYVSDISLFIHMHIVEGEIIVHSHPYKNVQGGPLHQHAQGEIQFFCSLSHYNIGDNAVGVFALSLQPLIPTTLSVIRVLWRFLSSLKHAVSLRAPPCCLFF